MLNVAQIESFYSYFYKQKYRDYKYSFKTTKTTESVCNSFLQLVDKKYSLHCVGASFLWDYFLFQFQYWEDLTLTNKFSDKIVLGWIVGKKAFQRWQERDKEFDWQIETYSIIATYELDKKYLLQCNTCEKPKIENPKSVPYDSSKPLRRQFHNTNKGFATCLEFTTLFDPKDISCIKCQFRTDCKELLKVNYPQLYKERIK
jgi:hypothetical protein